MDFFREKGWDKYFFTAIEKRHIRTFFDWLIEERGLSNKSYNDYIGFVSGLYNYFLERESLIKENLVRGFIKRLKVVSGKHVPYTPAQAKSILNYFEEKGDLLSREFLLFCYYTMARPREELRNLKVGDIGDSTIFFRPENAKTTHSSYIVIPEPLEEIIQHWDLRSYPAEYYIFSMNSQNGLIPGPKIVHDQYFYLRIKKALRYLGLTDKEYDLYSWKHTAVCQLFVSGVDIHSISQQCRHSDISQTIQYLKDLGIIRNSEVKANFPRL
jgi:integrase